MVATQALSVSYVYPFPSSLEVVDSSKRLRLATSGGVEVHPYFFKGLMRHPRRTSDMLLACSLVSRTRFYHPNELRERLLAAADPVVTSGGERLRFESFSVCCGVYCRVDLKPEAIDGDWTGRGTTNVDFNPPMRQALAGILDSEKVGLNVGADRVELETSAGKTTEKKVKLPVRWLKGFVEVQSYQAKMELCFEIPAQELRQLLKGLPQQKLWQRGGESFLVPSGKSVRLSSRSAPKAVAVGAPARLKVLEDLLHHAKTVRVFAGQDGVAAFELCSPEASFFVVLSPASDRGFSGEGQALRQLASNTDATSIAAVKAQLSWQAKIDPEAICTSTGKSNVEVLNCLSALGARGLVGYDLSEARYFHRELPFDMELVEELQPRLLKARKILEEKLVRISSSKNGNIDAFVKGQEAEHHVMITDDDARCTCPWYSQHPGERGPCSHILAVELAASES